MNNLPWFRMWSEARNDKKLATLTDAEHRVWFNLLCYASDQKGSRGAILDYDRDLLAIEVSNGDVDLLVDTLKKLDRLRIVRATVESEITFLHFEDRQYDKESDKPTAVRERVQRHRQKAKEAESETPSNAGDTPCNAQDSDCNAQYREETRGNAVEESREEEKREEQRREDSPQTPKGTDGGDASPKEPRTSPPSNFIGRYIDKFREAMGRDPILGDKEKGQLRAFAVKCRDHGGGIETYELALTGFFSDTAFAAPAGFAVGTLTSQQVDRWLPKATGRASPTRNGTNGHQPEQSVADRAREIDAMLRGTQ